MPTFLKDIEAEAAIVVMNGVYKQVEMAERDGLLYVKTGGGYVKVKHDGSTSKASLRLVHMSWSGDRLARTPTGDLCRDTRKEAIVLDPEGHQLLLGAPE